MSTPKPKVIIIGAGIGGLTLSKHLTKFGYPHEIYERDETVDSRYQGWAIAIRWYIDKLKAVAAPSAPEFESVSIHYKTGIETVFSMYSDGKSDAAFKIGGADKIGVRANRLKLRKWLLIDSPVTWNTSFKDYEIGKDGKITVHFADGKTTTGDILVGADGTLSHVREALYKKNPKSITPHLNLVKLGNVCAEVTLTGKDLETFNKYGSGFVFAQTATFRVFFGCKIVEPDRSSGRYYWMALWLDDNIENHDHWMYSKDKPMLLEKVKGLATELNPDFQHWFAITKPEDITTPLTFRDIVPQVGPPGPVTLLGDAAHAMTPFRGEGGNNAIEDAIELFDEIHSLKDNEYNKALRAYETKMTPRAEASVRESHRAAMDFSPTVVPENRNLVKS